MAEPDIRLVVSNTGDASPSGESANLIRDNLQKAFSHSPVHVKIQASTASLRGIRDSIIKELKDLKVDVTANVKTNATPSAGMGSGTTGSKGPKKDSDMPASSKEWIRNERMLLYAARERAKLKLADIKNDAKRLAAEKALQREYIISMKKLSELQTLKRRLTTPDKTSYRLTKRGFGGSVDDILRQQRGEEREVAKQMRANEAFAKKQADSVEAIFAGLNSSATSVVIGGKHQTINGINTAYADLQAEIEEYGKRSDRVSATEKKNLGERIAKFKELIQLYNQAQMPETKNAKNVKYTDKQSAKLDSIYDGLLREVEKMPVKKSENLKKALGDCYTDIMVDLIAYSEKSDEITDKEKQNIADRINSMRLLVKEMKNALHIEEANDKKAQAKKDNNADWAAGQRQKAKEKFAYFEGNEQAVGYARAKALIDDINAALDEYAVKSENIGADKKGQIASWVTELGRLEVQSRRTAEGFIATDQSRAQAQLGAARFEEYLKTLKPRALTEMAGQIEKIRQLFQKGTPAAIKEANDALKAFKADMKMLGYEGGNMLTYISEKMKTFITYLISSTITMNITSMLGKVVTNVKELDKAMTDLRIVTGDTKEETKDLIQSYNAMAQSLGTTTTSVAAGATDWLRQGYDAAESAELLRQSMTLSIVGAMESEDATNALTAAMKGYQLSVEEASDVVDKFFKVDMSAATSSSDLALALAKTAANAKLAGLSLDDVVGQLAVVNETMKESGEETGSFYNTMLSRMGNIKAGRVDDIETGEDLSDVESTLKQMGIALRNSSGQFRNFGEVLDEVGTRWNDYDNVQQRAIATAFAGTRQQTRFISLMEGWEKAGQYAESAADSAGVAAQKLIIYQDSVEAKAQKLTAAYEKLSMSLLSEDLVGMLYDMGTAFLNTVASIHPFIKDTTVLGTALTMLLTLAKAFKATQFGQAFIGLPNTLGWPEMTGDNIVPIYNKKAA